MACNIVVALDAIAAIQSAITCTLADGTTQAVTHAYPFGDWTVTAVNVPFFVNQIKGGPTNFAATPGLQSVDNVVDMFLCLWPISQGRSKEMTLRYVLEWRDAVFAAFAMQMRLGGTYKFVKQAHIQRWDHGAFTIGQTEYWAIRFELALDEAFVLPVHV